MAIKQCFYGLNSVKLCSTNQLFFLALPKVLFSSNYFSLFSPYIFSLISKAFHYSPPPKGGWNVEQYSGLYFLQSTGLDSGADRTESEDI